MIRWHELIPGDMIVSCSSQRAYLVLGNVEYTRKKQFKTVIMLSLWGIDRGIVRLTFGPDDIHSFYDTVTCSCEGRR